jgi:hypothetical protein
MAVCPSAWKKSAPTGLDVREIGHLSTSGKSVEKIQVLSKSDKNNGYFTWRPICIFDYYIAQLFLQCKQKNVVDKSKTHILFFF